jgi:hypothetical protein
MKSKVRLFASIKDAREVRVQEVAIMESGTDRLSTSA